MKKPIVGLAPMDGVTDAVFRYMVCLHSRPSFVMTEFVNVDGLARGAVKKIPAFIFDEIERPIVAQIFGVEVDSFYKAAVLVCALGFDGVDINMGCPAKKVEKKGSGAGLIKTPELAKDIIWAVKRGVNDWENGVSLEEAGVHSKVISECKVVHPAYGGGSSIGKRVKIPVSVKTRIGYDKPVTEEWIPILLEAGVDAVSLHGRTLKQMYGGEADWDEIAKAALICRKAGVMIIGNGDVKSMDDAETKIHEYGVDGVMAGRAVMGNPWFFGGDEPRVEDRIQAAKDHLKYFEKFLGKHLAYHTVKKHLGWYLKGFDGAR
ncbi:MAG: hypothetical protein GWP15_00330, partial [Nitrospirae bacterium]|nr:hypothetical protein [Nitrospirota bacterium]